MYKCSWCGKVFDEPKEQHEHHPYGMGYAIEKFYVCPYCSETQFDEAVECENCGKYCLPDELDDYGLCEECHIDEEEEEVE